MLMLNFENAPKKATNLSLNSKVLDEARKLEINISQTVDVLLANEVRRLYWEKWTKQNEEAIAAYNARVAAHGLPLAKYSTWGAALGDGQEGS
jgi:antitoxin CcdA